MSMTDPVADMLTSIRNASKAGHERLDIPSSNLKVDVAKLFKEEGYISNFRIVKDRRQGILRIFLKYFDRQPVILGLRRISKPGRRVYCGKNEVPEIRGGLGTAVISTSKGVMTDAQARRDGIGGELVCAVW